MKNKKLERRQHKTSEGELIYELLNSYQLCPKMSEAILETAKRCLIRENVLKEGQIEISVIGIEERSGKTIEKMEKVRVCLTIDNGKEDTEILKEYGRSNLRSIQIQRITQESLEQGGVLSQEDLSRLLGCDERTIRRTIRVIKEKGIDVITRGVLHCIGRCQTHKIRIVELYLEGKTFSEIKLKMHHSIGAIKRYIESFIRVLMSIEHGESEPREISLVTGLSEYLVRQYKEILEKSFSDKQRNQKLRWLIDQWTENRTRFKKNLILDEFGRKVAHMTGGVI